MTRPIEQGDWNMAYLYPQEVVEARERNGLVILPIAPIEWHGPHMVMGCDNLLAHAFARRIARELQCPYYPPLFIGTERERDPETLKSIGFPEDAFIEGMDFPANSIGSAYNREEVFALVLRDTVSVLFDKMNFRKVLIVNGHGAVNQAAVLTRLCSEFNGESVRRIMWVYPGYSMIGNIMGHADAPEASLLEAEWPGCTAPGNLPQSGPLRNIDFAIVDGDTFEHDPTPDHTVREARDPRYHTDAEWGRELLDQATEVVVAKVRAELLTG